MCRVGLVQGVYFFEYVSEGVLWASESVSGCCSLHGLQEIHQLSGCRTSISVLPQIPSDQVQQSLVADGLHQLRTTLGAGKSQVHISTRSTPKLKMSILGLWRAGLLDSGAVYT